MNVQNRRPRIVLYSHDTMGLGHIRRNLLIAKVLSESRMEPDVLLVSGALEAESFSMPEGVDCTILPSLYKEQDGRYRSRRLRISLSEIISLRRRILQETISSFDPDLLVVDGVPRGAVGELDSTLEYLSVHGHCSCVLGMRDVWDEPAAIKSEWDQRRNWDAIRRYYDQIWIYGDPKVYDASHEYRLEEDIVNKLTYTGYLDQRVRLETASDEDYIQSCYGMNFADISFVLCMLGSGQDGGHLARAFVDAELPQGYKGLLIAGPHIDPREKERLLMQAKEKGCVKLVDFVREPGVLTQQADCVVSMGGYNTICEIMSFKKRALIVPRVKPRREQMIRAERLQRLGVLEFLHPDDLEPSAITDFVEHSSGIPPPDISVDMNGLSRVSELAESLITERNCEIRGI